MHHANVIIGNEDERESILEILERELNFSAKANPDFLLLESDSFGIDDAREFKKWAAGKPLLGETKVSLIIVKVITHEAQNALLKVLEEPPAGTFIFINLESLGGLLPTFVSRVRILEIPKNKLIRGDFSKKERESNAGKFFNSDIRTKLALARSLSKDKDKNRMKELIKNLEKISYENYSKNLADGILKTEIVKNVLTAKVFASSRGSSPKMLLEWLSCVL